MKKSTTISIGISAIIVALVLGYVVFLKPKLNEPAQAPAVSEDNNQNDEVIDNSSGVDDDVVDDFPDINDDAVVDDNNDSDIDTASWKTYRNEEFGFEVKYPKDWVTDSPAYKGSSSKSGNVYHILGMSPYGFEGDWLILISVIPQSIDEVLKDNNYYWNKGWEIKSKENILINNTPAQKVVWSNEAIITYFQKPDKSLTIEFGGDAKKLFEINDVLSTFKFLK